MEQTKMIDLKKRSPAAIKTYILDQCEDLLVMLDQHGLQPDDAQDAYHRALKIKAIINRCDLYMRKIDLT